MRGLGSIYPRKGSRFLWLQYYQDGERRRESTGSSKLKGAQDALKECLGKIENRLLGRGKLLLEDLYESLEREYQMNGRKSLVDIKSRWQNHLKMFFGRLPAAKLTSDQITVYIVQRQQEKAANATINRELATLKRMYSLAIAVGKLTLKPYIPMLKERNVRKGFVKDAQYHKLAEATGTIGLWLRTMFEVAYSYGWRKTELLEMRVRQADLVERTLTLDPGTTKNDEARVVEMTNRVFELVRKCAEGKRPEDFLYTRDRDARGRRTRTQYIVDFRKDWRKACAAAGCPGLLFHDLRRSGVRNLVRAGNSEKMAMSISGHKTRAVFERYNIVNQADLKDAVKRLERFARDRQQDALFEQAEMFPDREERKQPQSDPGAVREPGAAKRMVN